MYKGMYVAATGAVMRSHEMDNVANNLANVSTSGFKRSTFSSRYYPIQEGIAQQQVTVYPDARAMTYFGSARVDTSPGVMQTTGNDLDVMIQGDGYFSVENNGRTFYTRNGSFGLDRNGFLVTGEGLKVLDRGNQPITIDPTEGRVTITPEGNVYLVNPQTQSNILVAELKVSRLNNPKHEGASLFSGNEVDADITTYEIVQGGIERSNVNPVRELIGMMEASRQYEMAQKVIQTFDDLAQRSVTDIANTRV